MKRYVYLLILIAGAFALVWLGRRTVVRSDSARHRRFASIANEEARAFKLGQSVRDKIPGTGEVLLIQLPARAGENQSVESEANRRVFEAFSKGLGTKAVPVAPKVLTREEHLQVINGVWGEQFLEWVKPHPHPRAIVSLIGLPGDISDQKLQALRPLVTSGRNGETLLAQ